MDDNLNDLLEIADEQPEPVQPAVSRIAKAAIYISYVVFAAAVAMGLTPGNSGSDWFPFLTERFMIYFVIGFVATIATFLLSIIAMIRIRCLKGRVTGYRQSLAALGILITSIVLWIIIMTVKWG